MKLKLSEVERIQSRPNEHIRLQADVGDKLISSHMSISRTQNHLCLRCLPRVKLSLSGMCVNIYVYVDISIPDFGSGLRLLDTLPSRSFFCPYSPFGLLIGRSILLAAATKWHHWTVKSAYNGHATTITISMTSKTTMCRHNSNGNRWSYFCI